MLQGTVADKPLGYIRIAAGGYDTAKTLAQLISAGTGSVSSLPEGTYRILIQAETQAARWTDDGTTPVAAGAGMLLAAGSTLDFQVSRLTQLRMVSNVAGGILHMAFYGAGV